MKFGEKVTVTQILIRRRGDNRRKVWRDKVIPAKNGICIGFRTLSEGFCDWDSDCGWMYQATNHLRAALVIFNERENPVYVRLDVKEKSPGISGEHV